MKQDMMQGVEHPERMAWYEALIGEWTGKAAQVVPVELPVWMGNQVVRVTHYAASVPAFDSANGFYHLPERAYGATPEEAMRALCEHVWTWLQYEQEAEEEYVAAVAVQSWELAEVV